MMANRIGSRTFGTFACLLIVCVLLPQLTIQADDQYDETYWGGSEEEKRIEALKQEDLFEELNNDRLKVNEVSDILQKQKGDTVLCSLIKDITVSEILSLKETSCNWNNLSDRKFLDPDNSEQFALYGPCPNAGLLKYARFHMEARGKACAQLYAPKMNAVIEYLSAHDKRRIEKILPKEYRLRVGPTFIFKPWDTTTETIKSCVKLLVSLSSVEPCNILTYLHYYNEVTSYVYNRVEACRPYLKKLYYEDEQYWRVQENSGSSKHLSNPNYVLYKEVENAMSLCEHSGRLLPASILWN